MERDWWEHGDLRVKGGRQTVVLPVGSLPDSAELMRLVHEKVDDPALPNPAPELEPE